MDIKTLISEIDGHHDCEVYPSIGQPKIKRGTIPEELRDFYSLCGGLHLFKTRNYSLKVVRPQDLRLSNIEIVGDLHEDDISSFWYLVAKGRNGEAISIDFSKERNGYCYDSFHEVHAVAGSCSVVAKSFSQLLHNLFNIKGESWYWLEKDFEGLGDAYD